jgi:hypothetical protein
VKKHRAAAADVKKPCAAKKVVYILESEEIARLCARRSRLPEDKRLFVEHQATRRREDDRTKTKNSVRTVPVAASLIPELKRWKLSCPLTARAFLAQRTESGCAIFRGVDAVLRTRAWPFLNR